MLSASKNIWVSFVCSDSQYDLTAVFEDQPYGLACIRWSGQHKYLIVTMCHKEPFEITLALCYINVDVVVGLNEYNIDVPNKVLCHILLK